MLFGEVFVKPPAGLPKTSRAGFPSPGRDHIGLMGGATFYLGNYTFCVNVVAAPRDVWPNPHRVAGGYHHTSPLPVQAWRTSINCRNAAKPPGPPPQICGGNPGGFAAYYRGGCRAGAVAGSTEGVEEMMLVMVGVGAWRGAGVLVAWVEVTKESTSIIQVDTHIIGFSESTLT